jgi:peptidoglycan hydrolase CwlO-like protein
MVKEYQTMTQTPVTVTYSLEEILGQINQKLDNQQKDINQKLDNLNQKVDNLQKDVTNIKVELAEVKGDIKTLDVKLTGQIKELEATVNGISKRLDTQEFINRSVVVGFVLAILAGLAKLFFPNFAS